MNGRNNFVLFPQKNVSFATSRPKFNFQVRLLKRIQLMEYPLIRDWITNLVSDSLKYSKFISEYYQIDTFTSGKSANFFTV